MKDPYQILGIPRTATDDEVKAAYRELARKYHPDKYRDSDLADLAGEKMKEINEAYDTIKKMRAGGGSAGAGQQAGYDSQYGPQYGQSGGQYDNGPDYNSDRTYSDTELFNMVRHLINANRIVEAENILNGMPESRRSAEWYYLKGCSAVRRRYYVDAQQFFDTACGMEPDNQEYRAAQTNLRNQLNNRRAQANQAESDCCDCCTALACLNCCCNSRGC